MKNFLSFIQQYAYSNSFASIWSNGIVGAIVLNKDGFVVFVEYTKDGKQIAVDNNGKAKEPVKLTNVRNGFVHRLLHSIQRKENVNYDKFYNACKKYYVEQVKNRPDYWKYQNNMDNNFLVSHKDSMEKQLVDIPLYDYLDEEDVKVIKSYCSNYLEWLDHKMQESRQKPSKVITTSDIPTEREKIYFPKAIEAGFMEKTDSGYRWLFNNGSKASLGYFLHKVFNPDRTSPTPYERMEGLFNVSRLDRAIDQLFTAIKPQKWREKIEALFPKNEREN